MSAALDVYPRVAMAILRHSRVAMTMEIYTQLPDRTTREALKRLSDLFDIGQADEPARPADEPGRRDEPGDDQDKAQYLLLYSPAARA
jgi:hypothetical protein